MGSSMHIVVCCLFSCGFLHCFNARDINCTVTQFPDQTVYNISDVSRVSDVTASDCWFSWANASDIVLANKQHKDPELVMRYSINSFTTSKCFDKIFFKRHCQSERNGYTANCMTNCSQRHKSRDEQKNIHYEMSPVTIAVILVVGLCVLGALCWTFRHRISSCIPLRRPNDPVQKNDDVEAGNTFYFGLPSKVVS